MTIDDVCQGEGDNNVGTEYSSSDSRFESETSESESSCDSQDVDAGSEDDNAHGCVDGGRDDDQGGDDDDVHIRSTRQWVHRIPIGLGLCPWAIRSHQRRRIRYRTCLATTPSGVEEFIKDEVRLLTGDDSDDDMNISDNDNVTNKALMTTLVICPAVEDWKNRFDVFDHFVRSLSLARPRQRRSENSNLDSGSDKSSDDRCSQSQDSTETSSDSYHQQLSEITFVAFHPSFLRWRGLPVDTTVGSVVESHRRFGLQKSPQTFVATVTETSSTMDNCVFGHRRVKVLFHDDNKEQYIPTDWVKGLMKHRSDRDDYHRIKTRSSQIDIYDDCNSGSDSDKRSHELNNLKDCSADVCPYKVIGPPLPDNAMHRSPHPTIHLIQNVDLGKLQARDVSRVKRKNAQSMMKLGWEGVELRIAMPVATSAVPKN